MFIKNIVENNDFATQKNYDFQAWAQLYKTPNHFLITILELNNDLKY